MLTMNEGLELAVFSDVVSRLEPAGIDYMLTGSVAMKYHAEPRMTRDNDIVKIIERKRCRRKRCRCSLIREVMKTVPVTGTSYLEK